MPDVSLHGCLETLLSARVSNGSDSRTVTITETDPKALLQEVSIVKVPETDTYVIWDDSNPACAHVGCRKTIPRTVSSLFNIGPEVKSHKLCDAILFFEKTEGLVCVVIDLKSKFPSGFLDQFRSTACFSRFIHETLRTFHDYPHQLHRIAFVILKTPTTRQLQKVQVGFAALDKKGQDVVEIQVQNKSNLDHNRVKEACFLGKNWK